MALTVFRRFYFVGVVLHEFVSATSYTAHQTRLLLFYVVFAYVAQKFALIYFLIRALLTKYKEMIIVFTVLFIVPVGI